MTDKYDERMRKLVQKWGEGGWAIWGDEPIAMLAAELRAVANETREECATEIEQHKGAWRGSSGEEIYLSDGSIRAITAAIRAKKEG